MELEAWGVFVGRDYGGHLNKQVEEPVARGDILVIFSDGINQARNDAGELFGRNGIIAAVQKVIQESVESTNGLEPLPEKIATEIMAGTSAHVRKERPDDDQALVVVQIV